ncbi:hypothetical protein IQ62_26355 [Streptomyces scabiei]|nr:hypothetical protein IQ62_26355 [Streptomyces scabiei]
MRARPQQPDVLLGQLVLEAASEVVSVADQRLGGPVGGEGVQQGLALVGFCSGQGEGDGQALEGAHQVQPQAPEEAAVTGAVPVLGPSGQVGTLDGLA